MEKGEHFWTVGGNADGHSHCGKQYGDNWKKLKMDLPFDPAIPLPIRRNPKHLFERIMFTFMFIAVLLAIAKIWEQPKCLSVDEWVK